MDNIRHLYGQPWKEREYVIALHYYFLHRDSPCHEDSSFVKEVAGLIGRTPASIAMRMENFASLDSDARPSHKGLSKGGPVCREMFLRWKDRRDHLSSCAEVFIRELKEPHPLSLFEPGQITMPKAFQKYELLDHLGDGGFASVFSCIEPVSRQTFALKILRNENRFANEILHRFLREMRILRNVQHEHVIRMHEDNLESEKSFPAFVMDLAECSLTQYLDWIKKEGGRRRPFMPTAEAAQLFRSIGSAVDALHHHQPKKVIHRDINPNNILRLANGTWVLADFGLAKFLQSAASVSSFVTNTGRGCGTLYYAAPEQYDDFTRTDERTDVYALGMLLWDLFTTATPYPQTDHPELPTEFEGIFRKAVDRNQSARYQSVAAMIADFDQAIAKWLLNSKENTAAKANV